MKDEGAQAECQGPAELNHHPEEPRELASLADVEPRRVDLHDRKGAEGLEVMIAGPEHRDGGQHGRPAHAESQVRRRDHLGALVHRRVRQEDVAETEEQVENRRARSADQDGPLATALAKLAAALNFPDLDVVLQEPVHLQELRTAAENFMQIEIEYWTAGRNEITNRRIDPLAVFFAEGAWYVDAFCHRANDDRLFRVDRIRAALPTARTFNPDRERPLRNTAQALYAPRATDPVVTIEIDAADRWVADHYPIIEVFDAPDRSDRVRISMSVSEPVFLHRILIRLGSTARVVGATPTDHTDGISTKADFGSFGSCAVALAMLDRYRDRI